MSDLERRRVERKVDVETKISEDRKQRNSRRFVWHEQVIKDPKLTPTAWRFAGLVMHDYRLTDKGYVAISLQDAAKKLSVSKKAIIEARDLLVTRGWLNQIAFRGQKKAHYEIAFPSQPERPPSQQARRARPTPAWVTVQ
jgi:hypothetical protein